MAKATKALLVFFNGKSNAGGAERMVQYFDEYLMSRGVTTTILDEAFLLNTWAGRLYKHLFRYRHFLKRKPIYMARFASAYLWTRFRYKTIVVSNGESTPFFPADIVISQGCYHVMEMDYGRKEKKLSRVARLQQRGLRICKQIITVTEKVKNDLITWYGIPSEKISIVTNRVDTNFFPVLPKPKRPWKTVLYAGRLEPGKGLPTVVRLAEIIDESEDWRLLVACNFPNNREQFEHFRHTTVKVGLNLENINEEAYAQADLVIFPSLSESFGMITLEALAAGVPVIGTPVGVLPDLHRQKMPGVYILEPFNDRAILRRFDEILEDFSLVDRNALHKSMDNLFGIPTYRLRLDEVIGPLIETTTPLR
ncbi:glycosyltransferase family 4 protein [Flavihumibacter petaseus]|uniref:Putative glycosyltransferase n=1 Tax=Flavihumibacter petaseus NBRC 106054 TaxID=1220578 RepID=A0A0E9MU91_9BACT|nr:glycosyltransferase family 4 protein [Flavihumibacter petaseus]GAO41043.1 putative glycosyltransferase [Flavihumibacter petaseus NBRC 106054]